MARVNYSGSLVLKQVRFWGLHPLSVRSSNLHREASPNWKYPLQLRLASDNPFGRQKAGRGGSLPVNRGWTLLSYRANTAVGN
jgi:hypothetical protein